MTTRILRQALPLAFLLLATAAVAQREGYSYLSWVGTEVSLVSVAEDDPAARPNTPILAGDRIATGPTSRAEAILADGNILRIDVRTNLRFDRLANTYEADDDRNSLYLERGAVSVEHRFSTSREQATRIDTDDATVLFPDEGLLRVETGRRGTEIYVLAGRAEVFARSGNATLEPGQYAFASGDASLDIDWLDEPRDGFARFVRERRDLPGDDPATAYVSTDYEYDYAVAGFEEHGSWVYVEEAGGFCWRPSVAADWRPYVYGYWRWSPAGLTWVSYEPWGWLPYHYGSWLWDTGFGWCWNPGVSYSPAWVYWSYTPSWVGWCPIGYYGGYYGGHHGGHHEPYYRSQRKRYGAERWTHAYPHLRGRVDVTRVDPRGWSYASVTRLGTRFDSRRDVLGHERVGFRPGERGVIATTPLLIDRGRGGAVTTAVQEAVRRVPRALDAEPRGGRGADDLTPVLRRDVVLGATVQEGLRRSFVMPGQDPGYRPSLPELLAAPRRGDSTGATAGNPSREAGRGPAGTTSPGRSQESPAPSRGTGPVAREPWRDSGVAAYPRGGRVTEPAPGRDVEPPLGGGFGRDRNVGGDDGWRSPGTVTRAGETPPRTFDVPARRAAPPPEDTEAPSRAVRREASVPSEPWRSTTQPPSRRETSPAPPPAQGGRSLGQSDAPAPQGSDRWRSGDAPTRPYEAPRPAPAPRSEAPVSRSHQAPSRSYEAPRAAPAPQSEAPSRSTTSPPSSSSPAPAPARSNDSAKSSAPPPG